MVPDFSVRRSVGLAVVGLVLLPVCACGADSDQQAGGTPPSSVDAQPLPLAPPTPVALPPTPSALVAWTHATAAENCVDTTYSRPLTVSAESYAEVPSLALIDACTNGSQTETYLRNRSDLVWRLYSDGPSVETTHSTRTPAQEVLHSVAGNGAVMEPGSAVVVQAGPELVHWYADPSLTASYATVTELQDKALETALDKSPDLFREGSRARAHVTCAAAALTAARDATEVSTGTDDDQRTEALASSVESVVTGAGECRDALAEADAVKVREGEIASPVLRQLDETPELSRLTAIAGPVEESWAVSAPELLKVLHL